MKQLEFQSDNQVETHEMSDMCSSLHLQPAQRIIVMSPCPQPAQYVTLLCGDWRYLEIGTLMTHLLLILILIKRCSPAQQYGYNRPTAGLSTGLVNTTLATCLNTAGKLQIILGAHAKDIECNFASCAVKPFLQTDPLVSVLSASIIL